MPAFPLSPALSPSFGGKGEDGGRTSPLPLSRGRGVLRTFDCSCRRQQADAAMARLRTGAEAPSWTPGDLRAVALHAGPDAPVVGLAGLQGRRLPGVEGCGFATVNEVPPDKAGRQLRVGL